MRKITNEMVIEAAEGLIGTCRGSIEQTIETMFPGTDANSLTLDQFQICDEKVFDCNCCGWFCESGTQIEVCGDLICEDCQDSGMIHQ